eukprot:3763304-Prymnesium_polylepis.3
MTLSLSFVELDSHTPHDTCARARLARLRLAALCAHHRYRVPTRDPDRLARCSLHRVHDPTSDIGRYGRKLRTGYMYTAVGGQV